MLTLLYVCCGLACPFRLTRPQYHTAPEPAMRYSPRYPAPPPGAPRSPISRAIERRGGAHTELMLLTLRSWRMQAQSEAEFGEDLKRITPMLQAAARGWLERRRHRMRMEKAREARLATFVAKLWRGKLARRLYFRKKAAAHAEAENRQRHKAVTTIASRVRGNRQREEQRRAGGVREWARQRREREEREARMKAEAETMLADRGRAWFTKEEKDAATRIQCVWRGRKGRKAAKDTAQNPWLRVKRVNKQLTRADVAFADLAKHTMKVLTEGKAGEEKIARLRAANEAAMHQLRGAIYGCIDASERHKAAERHFYVRRNELDYRIHTFDPQHGYEISNATAGRGPPSGTRRTELPWTHADDVKAARDPRTDAERGVFEPFAPAPALPDAPAAVIKSWEDGFGDATGARVGRSLLARKEARQEERKTKDVAKVWQMAGKPLGAGSVALKAFGIAGEQRREREAAEYMERARALEAASDAKKAARKAKRVQRDAAHARGAFPAARSASRGSKKGGKSPSSAGKTGGRVTAANAATPSVKSATPAMSAAKREPPSAASSVASTKAHPRSRRTSY